MERALFTSKSEAILLAADILAPDVIHIDADLHSYHGGFSTECIRCEERVPVVPMRCRSNRIHGELGSLQRSVICRTCYLEIKALDYSSLKFERLPVIFELCPWKRNEPDDQKMDICPNCVLEDKRHLVSRHYAFACSARIGNFITFEQFNKSKSMPIKNVLVVLDRARRVK